MALKYNGTSPTAIKYNGTDLTVLKYGTTAVWGKPYSLTITKDSYTTVTVNRTSSPNQGASTGNLSSGSVVYYGDVLKITATANSGYNRTTFKVNGLDYGDSITITVTSAVTVEAYSSPAQSWKTVWTGNTRCDKAFKYSTGVQTANISGLTGMVYGRPTRINFRVSWYEENSWGGGEYTFNGLNEYEFIYQNTTNTMGTIGDLTKGAYSGTPKYCFYTYELLGDGLIQFTGRKYYDSYGYWQLTDFYITSIEQYY